ACTALAGSSASARASAAASANSSADVRSCLPNFVTPTPITATRRMRPPWWWLPCRRPIISGDAVRRPGSVAQLFWFLVPSPVSMGLPSEGRRARAMLSEEALIVLAGFGACGLLMLGVMELIWPTRPRHPVRLRRPVPAHRALAARAARVQRASLLQRQGLELGRSPQPRRAPASLPPVPLPVEAAVAVAELPEAAPLPAEPVHIVEVVRVGSVVDECFALQQSGRFGEVVELATAALGDPDDARRPADAHATAALWSVVALARQGLGEDVEAREALEAAVAWAPAADRPTYQRQLAALAEGVARRLLAEADQHPRGESEECLEAIRSATGWLEHGVAA